MIIPGYKLRKMVRSALLEAFERTGVGSDPRTGGARSSGGAVSETAGKFPPDGLKYDSIENSEAASVAKEEWKLWNPADGKLKEKDKQAYPILKKYWDDLKWPAETWTPAGTAWSAAFISWVMKQSGTNFFNASAHSEYATSALKNRMAIIESDDPKKYAGKVMYVLFMKGEDDPVPGDALFYVREGTIESWIDAGGGKRKAHTDVFVGGGKSIGGNLSDSVTTSKAMGKHTALIKKIKITSYKEEEAKKAPVETDTGAPTGVGGSTGAGGSPTEPVVANQNIPT